MNNEMMLCGTELRYQWVWICGDQVPSLTQDVIDDFNKSSLGVVLCGWNPQWETSQQLLNAKMLFSCWRKKKKTSLKHLIFKACCLHWEYLYIWMQGAEVSTCVNPVIQILWVFTGFFLKSIIQHFQSIKNISLTLQLLVLDVSTVWKSIQRVLTCFVLLSIITGALSRLSDLSDMILM